MRYGDRPTPPSSHATPTGGNASRFLILIFSKLQVFEARGRTLCRGNRVVRWLYFGDGRRLRPAEGGRELADSPHVRTPAQTSRRHRIPRARVPLYSEPQDCSYDSAAGQCARLMSHLLPGRFRWLPVHSAACAPRSPGEFDALRPDTANHPGPRSPTPTGRASASRGSVRELRGPNRVFNSFRHGSLRSYGQRLAKPLDNLRRFVEHRRRTPVWRRPMTRSGLCVCPRCGPLVTVEDRGRRSTRRSDVHHCRRACRGRDRHRRRLREVRGKVPSSSPGAQSSHRRGRRLPRRPGAVLQGGKGPPRRTQPLASRVGWTAIRILSRQRGRDTAATSPRRRADTRPPQCGNVQRGTEPHSGQICSKQGPISCYRVDLPDNQWLCSSWIPRHNKP